MSVDAAVEGRSENGRDYHNQAMVLISLCRRFSRDSIQQPHQYFELKRVLEACDSTLRAAAHPSKEVARYEVNKRFKLAVEMLSEYARRFHPRFSLIGTLMDDARKKDRVLNKMSQVPQTEEGQSGYITVKFALLETLPDPNPIVLHQTLGHTVNVPEILWNFYRSRDSRHITLQKNPHFYLSLPTSARSYGAEFRAFPAEHFYIEPKTTIYILVDRPRRVFLETQRETRIFGNVFKPNDIVIFKDGRGVLEGESVIAKCFRGMPNLWHCKTRFVSPDPSDQVYHLCLRPIVTVLPIARWTCKDWRDLVRRTQGPGDSDLHIHARQRPPEFNWTLYRPPPPPTSERPGYEVLYRIPINILNDDTLLEIFNHCRLGDEQGWDLQLQWGKLSHVCRRWRSLIFGSPSYLKIRLPVLNRTSILPMLTLFPPLPIIIDCKASTRIAHTTTSAMIMLFAPVHRDRIRHIALQASPQHWHQLLVHMNESFQRLEYLSLASTATQDPAKLTLPESFMAPNLCHLTLIGIGLPKGLPLLASTVALVSLKLCRIQLFSPEDLVTRLQHMPQLKELSIDFRFLTPRPITDGVLTQTSIPVATLPALKQLEFHGLAAYLEGLVSRTNAPALERLTITLFNQATFTLPHLSQFMNTTEGLRHPIASILFDREAVSIAIRHREPPFEDVFNLRLGYSWFNWQINSAAQICGTLLPVLSIVEELTLDSYEYLQRLRWLDAVTNARMWRDLILPFKHVRKLSISHALWLELSTAIHPNNERPELFLHRLLPSLQTGEINSGIQHQIQRFIIDARPLGPVVLTPLRGRQTIDRSGSVISLSDSDEDSTSHVSSVRRNRPQRTIRIVNLVRNLRRLVPHFPTGS